MKPLYLLSIIYVTLIMSGCTRPVNHQVMMPTTETIIIPGCPHNYPTRASMRSSEEAHNHSCHVIATAKVSKYNIIGITQQEATIRDIMRELTASANSDALIDIKHREKEIIATVITYR